MIGVKEQIYTEIDKMALNELALLYEQIRLIKRVKRMKARDKDPISIEELHKFTSTSKDSWADDVIMNREDRV